MVVARLVTGIILYRRHCCKLYHSTSTVSINMHRVSITPTRVCLLPTERSSTYSIIPQKRTLLFKMKACPRKNPHMIHRFRPGMGVTEVPRLATNKCMRSACTVGQDYCYDAYVHAPDNSMHTTVLGIVPSWQQACLRYLMADEHTVLRSK